MCILLIDLLASRTGAPLHADASASLLFEEAPLRNARENSGSADADARG